MSHDHKIITERRGHLLLLGFNRADKMNAFDSQMLNRRQTRFTGS